MVKKAYSDTTWKKHSITKKGYILVSYILFQI